jgi:HSP20 family protein
MTARRKLEFSKGEAVAWIPPVDIYETEDAYVLCAEVPGVEREDIKIEVAGSELSIRGERRFESPCAAENYQRLEAPRGRFHRTFTLPERLNSTGVSASMKDGVLEVKLPKAAGGRRIAIQSSSPADR